MTKELSRDDLRHKLKIGTKVHVAKGTKDGIGVIEGIWKDGYFVTFPQVDYPESMMTISGSYAVGFNDIIEVITDA